MLPRLAHNRPSGFARTIACPGSRRLLAKCKPGGTSSFYAREGSAAHELIYNCLTSGTLPFEHLDTKIEVEDDTFTVDWEMINATQNMVGMCRELLHVADWTAIEKKLVIPGLDMPNGGTGDFVALAERVLWVVDYKHGKGVYVETEGNAQFLSYAHGATCTMPEHLLDEFDTIRLVCVQPRFAGADPIRTWSITKDELVSWLSNVAFPAVKVSQSADAPLVPGSHCKFCDASGFCTAPLQKTLEAMKELTP